MEDIEKTVKSLRWLVNMFPAVLGSDNQEDRMSTCIHLYCEAAADALERQKNSNEVLRAENERLRSTCYPRDGVEAIIRERDRFKAERDVAIEDWRGFCAKCSKRNKRYLSDGQMDAVCATCRANGKCNWEWRGPVAGEGATE